MLGFEQVQPDCVGQTPCAAEEQRSGRRWQACRPVQPSAQASLHCQLKPTRLYVTPLSTTGSMKTFHSAKLRHGTCQLHTQWTAPVAPQVGLHFGDHHVLLLVLS